MMLWYLLCNAIEISELFFPYVKYWIRTAYVFVGIIIKDQNVTVKYVASESVRIYSSNTPARGREELQRCT
jgi:hypothetical protein